MNFNPEQLTLRMREIVSELPMGTKLIEADGYRDPDFGSNRVGVSLEFSTGHLHLVVADVPEGQGVHDIAAMVAMLAVLHLAFRPVEWFH